MWTDSPTLKTGRSRAGRWFSLEGVLCACGEPATMRHHIDEDPTNNAAENIEPVCRSCHGKRHTKPRLCEGCRREVPSNQSRTRGLCPACAYRQGKGLPLGEVRPYRKTTVM